jgi:chloramphenicol 3-O phosphotransferase
VAAHSAAVIVLLNGASSSGKTTLAKALQRRLPEPYLLLGIDTVVFALPGRWLNLPLWHEVFGYHGPPEALTITAGPVGDRLVRALHRMVAAAAETGWDVIVDHVLLDERWVADAATVLGRFPLFTVALRCPLAELQRRERDRGDRTVGQARAHFDTVHRWARHDLDVDTHAASPDICAQLILDALHGHDGRSALTGQAG